MVKITVFFEAGQDPGFKGDPIDPRNRAFDHHGAVAANNSFILPMASVQLIQWIYFTNIDPQDIEIKMNHAGHLDDFCAYAIVPAHQQNKLRSLHQFAATVSVVDALGRGAKGLLNQDVLNIVEGAYQIYHQELNRIKSEVIKLEERLQASKKAGEYIANQLPEDQYQELEVPIPVPGSYKVIEQKGDVVLVEAELEFNAIEYQSHFYREFDCKVVVFYQKTPWHEEVEVERFTYTITGKSAFIVDLTSLWPLFRNQDQQKGNRVWGGHPAVGGGRFSILPPEKVFAETLKFLMNRR